MATLITRDAPFRHMTTYFNAPRRVGTAPTMAAAEAALQDSLASLPNPAAKPVVSTITQFHSFGRINAFSDASIRLTKWHDGR